MIYNYKQCAPPWGSLPFDDVGQTICQAGCGGTASADIVGATPDKVCKWLKNNGYVSPGYGTYWGGIPAAIQAYGTGAKQLNYTSLYGVTSCATFDTFRRHIQSGYGGSLLMGPGRFTTGGHYICISAYKDGLYKVNDPAGRQDGWHPWSDFAGEIKVCYTTQAPWGSEPAPEPWTATGTATCKDNGVNFRVTPNGAIIGTLNAGMRFEVDGTIQGEWTHAKVAGLGIGWVATRYVVPDTPAPVKYAYSFTVPGLIRGAKSRAVTLFERLLAPKNIYTGPSDTYYGDACVEACKKIQELRALSQTGRCYLEEWSIITGLPHDGATFHVSAVQWGSQGASVAFVQLILAAYGFYYGATVDGIAGDATRAAIITFQQFAGLATDGVAGPKTLEALVGF